MSQNAPPSTVYEPDPDVELNDRQLAAIPLLLEGRSDTGVAQAIGIDRKTIYRWRVHDLTFGSELRRARIEIYRACVDRLCSLLNQAIDVLERQVKASYATTSQRAARTLLSLAGIGRAAARLMNPMKDAIPPQDQPTRPPHQPQPTAMSESAGPALSRSAARAISKAVDAMDLLGLRSTHATG